MTNAEARFNNSLRPRKPEGSLGRTAQDGHLDSHTAPELLRLLVYQHLIYTTEGLVIVSVIVLIIMIMMITITIIITTTAIATIIIIVTIIITTIQSPNSAS